MKARFNTLIFFFLAFFLFSQSLTTFIAVSGSRVDVSGNNYEENYPIEEEETEAGYSNGLTLVQHQSNQNRIPATVELMLVPRFDSVLLKHSGLIQFSKRQIRQILPFICVLRL